ncbi:MarR family winged helix-turn-helix transcriptional regulator [Bordetella genomosp. 4]|uniref:MarR family winged helix-turn-helix transcriptional regulator n=1 Tax=Bordetella genomosp. 4 TaxID=463044 RepID=UPI000B9E112C|nr:MarR family transcriptional regulator [Bordetella genomosp. 4]OZI45169.1 MarR family transcriptional regulator [Bordetella genomosp. 4]
MNELNQNAAVRAELQSYQKRTLLYTRPGFLIRRLHQIHSWLFSEETSAFNITPVQYSLLTALRERGELDQNSLALDIGLERSSVAEVLPRLETRGLIERRQSPEDGRVKLVRLTREGRTLVKRMQPAVQRAHDRTIEQLPEEARDLFMLQMIRLVEANNSHAVAPLRVR